jgi:hypothetical protein
MSQDAGDILTYAAMVVVPCMGAGLLVALARYAHRYPQRRRGLVLVWANILVFAVLSSVAVLALESYYRFWCDETDSFGLSRVSERWLQRHYHFNQGHVRDNVEYSLQRAPGQRRITFLGDSFTEGYGIANVDDRFANRIRRMEKGWEIHVVAGAGYDTGDELKEAQWFVQRRYQLDQVVLVYCLNDIADIVPEWQTILNRIYETNQPGFLFRHSFFFNTLHYRLRERMDPDISNYYHFVRQAYDGPLWDKQKQRLRYLWDVIDGNGGHLMVVTFPFLHEIGPHYEYGPVHEKLDAFWQTMRVPHLDLLTVYAPHQGARLTVNRHDAHPNVYAHSLAADAILKFIQDNISPNRQQPDGNIESHPR